jgi:hypothetical protein
MTPENGSRGTRKWCRWTKARRILIFRRATLARQGEHRKVKSQSDFGHMRRFLARDCRFQVPSWRSQVVIGEKMGVQGESEAPLARHDNLGAAKLS